MRLQAQLKSPLLVTALAVLVAVVALSYGYGVILAYASGLSFESPVNVTPSPSSHPSTSSWTATIYSSIPGFADYTGSFSFIVGNDNNLYGSGTITKTYYLPGCAPGQMTPGSIGVKGYIDASKMVHFYFTVTQPSNDIYVTCSGTSYQVYGATDGFENLQVTMPLVAGQPSDKIYQLSTIDSSLPDYIQITLQGANTYDVSVSLSGVPESVSANVWLDGMNQGTIGGAEIKTLTISLTSISHTITVDQYLTGPDGTRYYCAQNTWTVTEAGSHTFTYETLAGNGVTTQPQSTLVGSQQPPSPVDTTSLVVAGSLSGLAGASGYALGKWGMDDTFGLENPNITIPDCAKDKLKRLAQTYNDRTNRRITVTSGIRSPGQEAMAIVNNLQKNPDYWKIFKREFQADIKQAFAETSNKSQIEQQKRMEETIERLMNDPTKNYVGHVKNSGGQGAVDIRKSDIGLLEQEFIRLAQDAGFKVLAEGDHYHLNCNPGSSQLRLANCTNCGTPLPKSVGFCTTCGQNIEARE